MRQTLEANEKPKERETERAEEGDINKASGQLLEGSRRDNTL